MGLWFGFILDRPSSLRGLCHWLQPCMLVERHTSITSYSTVLSVVGVWTQNAVGPVLIGFCDTLCFVLTLPSSWVFDSTFVEKEWRVDFWQISCLLFMFTVWASLACKLSETKKTVKRWSVRIARYSSGGLPKGLAEWEETDGETRRREYSPADGSI